MYMQKKILCLMVLLSATLTVAFAEGLLHCVIIPSSGQISYPTSGQWQYEPIPLNFWVADVEQGGTLVIAGDQGSGAVYRSMDEGLTWSHVFTIPGASRVRGVFIDSRKHIFVSGIYGNGIYRSTDGGDSWICCLQHPGSPDLEFTQSGIVEINGILYLGTYTMGYVTPTIYRSTNGGASWEALKSWPSGHVHCLKYASATGKLWCWVGDPEHSGYGLYWSDDLGQEWTRTSITEGSLLGMNIMSFEPYANYLFLARHWSNAELYRVDVEEIDGIPPNNPPAQEVWRGEYTLLNWAKYYRGWLIASGEANAGQTMLIGGSGSPPFSAGSWENVYVDGSHSSGDRLGCAAVSYHYSLNGWLFVSNTITGQGIRIRYI